MTDRSEKIHEYVLSHLNTKLALTAREIMKQPLNPDYDIAEIIGCLRTLERQRAAVRIDDRSPAGWLLLK